MLKRPNMCSVKSVGFKDIKYDIQIAKYTNKDAVCLLILDCKKRLQYLNLLNHHTSTFVLKIKHWYSPQGSTKKSMCVIKLSLTFCSSRPPQLCWKLVHRVSLPIHSWLKQDNYKIETFTFMQSNLLPFQFGWNPVLFVSISVPSAQFQIPFCSTFSIPPTQTPKFARSVYLFLIPPNQIAHCLNLFWFYLQIHCHRTAAWGFKDIGRDLKDVVIVFLALASPGSPLDWIFFVSWWLNWSLRIPFCYFKTMSSVRWGQWLGASIHSEGLKGWPVGSYQ